MNDDIILQTGLTKYSGCDVYFYISKMKYQYEGDDSVTTSNALTLLDEKSLKELSYTVSYELIDDRITTSNIKNYIVDNQDHYQFKIGSSNNFTVVKGDFLEDHVNYTIIKNSKRPEESNSYEGNVFLITPLIAEQISRLRGQGIKVCNETINTIYHAKKLN